MHPRLLALPLLALAALAACSDDDAAGTAATSPITSPTSATGGADGVAPTCDLAAADLATLFPGATAGDPVPSATTCNISMTTSDGVGYFLMDTSALPYDERLQNDTDHGFTISQLDGIGERAYYSRGNAEFSQADLLFELNGTAYVVRAQYTDSGVEMIAEPTLQDTLQRIAAAWAASL